MRTIRLLCLVAMLGAAAGAAQEPPFDLVIRGGRVIDPETRVDRIANVGIRGSTVVTVTDAPIAGARVIDARGRVVAPGFIDILSGAITPEGGRYKVTDGVTSLLAMHGGPVNVAAWYDSLGRAGMHVNYGTTVGHGALRLVVGIADREKAATDEQLSEMVRLARRAIMEGAVGIGFGVQYTPGASAEEVLALFRLGAEFGVPVHLHTRFLGPLPPENSVKGVQEVIADAAATGASAQVVHLNSISVVQREVETALELIAGARARGIDVMADAYHGKPDRPGWNRRCSTPAGRNECRSAIPTSSW